MMKKYLAIFLVSTFLMLPASAFSKSSCTQIYDTCYSTCDTKLKDDDYKRRDCKKKCLTDKLSCQSIAKSKKLEKLTNKGAEKVENFLSGLKK